MSKPTLLLALLLALFAVRQRATLAQTGVQQVKFTTADAYLLLEFLDDDLVHLESGLGSGPEVGTPISTSPMVAKSNYAGPTAFSDDGQGTLTTASLQLTIDQETLCSTVVDLARAEAGVLTAVCPTNLDQRQKSLTLDPTTLQNAYGLGEQFRTPGEPNGDWVGSRRTAGIVGNEMQGFSGGAVGNAQFPILYALGDGSDNFALFVDVVYKQEWDFTGTPWSMTTAADPLRWYVLTGPDLPDLRADYLELTGRPPVPPKALFGLWVSEYGYDNWAELSAKRQTLDDNQFPQDGFVLDLQWFGGIQTPSQMGALSWDLANFPDPATQMAQLQATAGLNIIVIEESYVDQALSNFGRMASQSYLVKSCATCGPVVFQGKWWGTGGMVDWTNQAGAALWHDTWRQPLIDAGVMGHWTDLGEPEMFAPNSWYAGLPGLNLHDEAANHNIYNLQWAESIYLGYERNGVAQRPSILSRSGITGSQRYGVAMWSADIGSNFDSLAAHMNAQMHMSLSGVDYFGSDVGGFHRGNIGDAELDELYTIWFANSALLDVPVRPHTENLCNCKETAPDRVGDQASNLANIRLRYSLSPYLYSLAHRAWLTGEPVVPPLLFYFQADVQTRELGDHKLLGADVLVRTVSEPGVTAVPVYLPAGQWVDFYSGAWIDSTGQWLDAVPVYDGDLFRLPLYLHAGAIIPRMVVDEQTMNLAGLRRDGSERDELLVQIVPAPEASTFTLYEDDGRTTAYQSGEVRTTELSQQWTDRGIAVTIAAAVGTYDGAGAVGLPKDARNNVLEIALPGETVTAVQLNGQPLPPLTSQAEFVAAESGWYRGKTAVYVKSGVQPVDSQKAFVVQLAVDGEPEVVASVVAETAVPTAQPVTPTTNRSTTNLIWVIGLGGLIIIIAGTIWQKKSKAD